MTNNRRVAVAAVIGALLGVSMLSACSVTPSSPEEKAAAKASEWRTAAYGGDQAGVDRLYCKGQDPNWNAAKVKGWSGDKDSAFDKPIRESSGKGTFDVVLHNPAWSSAIHVVVDTAADPACIRSAG